MYTCQCKGYQMGQSSGVLFKEVAAFQRLNTPAWTKEKVLFRVVSRLEK